MIDLHLCNCLKWAISIL